MATEADFSFVFFAAELLAEGGVLGEDAEREEVEFGIVRYPWGAVGVVQKIRCQREETSKWRFFIILVWGLADQILAKEFVGICEVISSQKDSCLLGRPSSVSLLVKSGGCTLILQHREHLLGFFCTRWAGFVFLAWREGPQAKVNQCAEQRPPFGGIVLHSNITVPHSSAREPDSLDNLLDACLIDKVVKSQLVRVLELKFVVVC